MRVYDIYPEASEYLGTNDQTHIFRVLGRAAEYLANKGDWDILKGYIDLAVQQQNIVVLPWQVETPLKFTMDGIPAFSRDRLYEFTLNGFGGNAGADRTEYGWEDRGFIPVLVIPPSSGFQVTTPPSPANAGKQIYLQGQDRNNFEQTETMVISATSQVRSVYTYAKLTEVNKDLTPQVVPIFWDTSGGGHQPVPPTPLPPPPSPPPVPDVPSTSVPSIPTVRPLGGAYSHFPLLIAAITDRVPGETMIYTLDGSIPSLTNGIIIPNFSGQFYINTPPVGGNVTLKIVSVLNGNLSPINTQVYSLAAGQALTPPAVTPIGGAYSVFPMVVNVMCPDQLAGETMMYTLNSRDPTLTFGTPINASSGTITIPSANTTLRIIAISGTVTSLVEVDTYTLAGAGGILPPTANPPGGDYPVYPMQVAVACQLGNPLDSLAPTPETMLYTLDGSDPSLGPPVNGTPINATNGTVTIPQPLTTLKNVAVVGTQTSPIDTEVYLLNGPPPPPPPPPPTSGLMSIYYPNETNPRYRMLALSQIGVTARFLFRRKVFKIYTMDDFIPIQSELGFLTMLQAVQALRRKDFETAKASADAAVEITTDAQRATTGFIELANQTEVQAARNYQIYNRDSVIMLDVFDEFAEIWGNVGQFKIFDEATKSLEALCAKGHWDGLTGYVDITVDGRRNVTLPRFVDEPVAISINGRPSYMKNKWAEFHLNGPGSDEQGGQWMGGRNWTSTWGGRSGAGRWGQVYSWDSVGQVVTVHPLGMPSQLVAIPDDPIDDGKIITVYGYDQNGKWIRTNGVDGFQVVTNHLKLVPIINGDQIVARIVRITRQQTNGFVHLWAFDNMTQTTSTMLGYYYPDETVPQYFRIKLPVDARWIRMRYRKRTLKVTSVWQPLHLYSRLAITTMSRSLKTLKTDAAGAQVFEDKAVRFLDEDQKARNPGETFQLQFNEDAGWNSNFILS